MNSNKIPLFDEKEWDFMQPEERNEHLAWLLKSQLRINKTVPAYKEIYSRIDEKELTNIADIIKKVPVIDKTFLRQFNSPYDLVPKEIKENPQKIYLHRGTGGTTGKPTSIFYTKEDWEAILGGMTRAVQEIQTLKKPLIAFNGYNQGHISGPIFDDTIRKLGGTPIARNFGSNDEQAVQQMKDHKCNLIIAPPTSTHKGGSIEDLLEADARIGTNYINGENIDVIFCSSTNLTPELYKELKELGIKYIYNYYGSTEILPTAISCQENPFELHILQGHISLFVIDEQQKQVLNRERGIVIASRIGSQNKEGNVQPNQATQLLNYEVGDEVTIITEKCECGRTTPRITNVQRIKGTTDKMTGGCEVW